MKRFFTTLALAFIACVAVMAEAYSPKTVPNPRTTDAHAYVCNPDTILTYEEVQKLQSIAEKVDSLAEVELVIVALRDIGDATPFDFALDLFNTWGVGNKEKNTGVMIFLTLQSGEGRNIRIITGNGIEGLLPDGECSLVLDEMIPELKESYGQGMITGAKAIARRVTTDSARAELLLDNQLPEPTEAPWSTLALLLGLGGTGYAGSYYLKRKCQMCNQRTLKQIDKHIVSKPTRTRTGKGVRTYRCQKCGHEFTEYYTIPRLSSPPSSSGGGGGFSSGGGGSSFGGGGGSFGGGFSSGGGAGRSF